MKNERIKGESKLLSQFYSIFAWPDDPESEQGKQYFETTLDFMERLIQHPWIEKVCRKKEVKILDVCGGAGFGGVALSRILLNKVPEVSLLITDLRESALQKAEKWGAKVVGKRIETSVVDAKEVHTLKGKFDLALMYGLSTPHFDPWELVKLFSSVSECLPDDGIFIVDEADRRYSIFVNVGYKWALAEREEEGKLTVSFHAGYDALKGTCKRAYIDFTHSAEPVTMEVFFWGLAEVATLMWIFFKDVDLVKLRDTRHFILGYNPRRILKPTELKQPNLFKERK